VAGIIGGKTVGVAKEAALVSVRVFDCSGSSSTSTIISGIDWIVANRKLPAVANLSLGGGISLALDMAIQRLVDSGVVAVVAAGNDGKDACSYSPARAVNAITVGATEATDSRASYSNYGDCVDFFAPGSAIRSAWYNGDSAYNTISGTSMATPHVSGVVALQLERAPLLRANQMRDLLLSASSKAVVTSSLSFNNHIVFTEDQTMGTGDYSSPVDVALLSPKVTDFVRKGSKITLQTSARDDKKLKKVEYRSNGVVVCTSTAAPFSCSWTTPRTAQTIVVDVKATDTSSNATSSPYVFIQVQ